ncbi:uncharacterized protein LOC135399027 [Ornithodoros turicata]|uniref:uncharacterized protein LOC135399027 n=1 Tax=Ornithodoros turicata TaxID=34597 RepID=UPI00313A152F
MTAITWNFQPGYLKTRTGIMTTMELVLACCILMFYWLGGCAFLLGCVAFLHMFNSLYICLSALLTNEHIKIPFYHAIFHGCGSYLYIVVSTIWFVTELNNWKEKIWGIAAHGLALKVGITHAIHAVAVVLQKT